MKVQIYLEDLVAITNVAEAFVDDMGDDQEYTEDETRRAIAQARQIIWEKNNA